MPSSFETWILFTVLLLVLASLPVAMKRWRRQPGDAGALPVMPGVPLPVPVASSEAVPPPLPSWYAPNADPYAAPFSPVYLPAPDFEPDKKPAFGKADAWFAFGLVMMVSLLMGPVSALLVMMMGKDPGTIEIEYTATLFLYQIIFQAGIIVLVLVWLMAVRKFNPLQIFGIKERGPLLTIGLSAVWLVVAYIALIVLSLIMTQIVKAIPGMELKQQGLVESAPEIKDSLTRILMVITLCIGAPLMEEFIFRGIIFGVALRYFRPVYATVASSVLFGVIHNNLLSLIPLTILGIFLAEAYRRTRTLAVPLLMHATFNGITFLILMYGPEELKKL